MEAPVLIKTDGDSTEKPKSVRDIVQEKSAENCKSTSWWLWKLFLLGYCTNIIFGLFSTSAVFLSPDPDDYFCAVGELIDAGWTPDQIRTSMTASGVISNNSCTIFDLDYSDFKNGILDNLTHPVLVNCLSSGSNSMFYAKGKKMSIASEWDLVCYDLALRSMPQVSYALGKVIGGVFFGIISDQYGRRLSFTYSAILVLISTALVTFSSWYALLLVARFGIGIGVMGLLLSTHTLISENTIGTARTYFVVGLSTANSIGIILLATIAYFVRPWRWLSLALSLPSLIFFAHFIFLVESPRWLLSKNRLSEAYQMVFGKKMPKELLKDIPVKVDVHPSTLDNKPTQRFYYFKKIFRDTYTVYTTPHLRWLALNQHTTSFISVTCYYVTGLNGSNLTDNQFLYIGSAGVIDIIGAIAVMIALLYFGRRLTVASFYLFSAITLLLSAFLPYEYSVFFALLGRCGMTAVLISSELQTVEIFPTDVRTSMLGINSVFAQSGTVAAPYIVDLLGAISWWIPCAVCGVFSLFGAFLKLLLPETRGKLLRDHLAEEGPH